MEPLVMMELSGMDVDVTVLGLVGGVSGLSGMDALAACKTLAQAAAEVQWWHAQALQVSCKRAWADARIDYKRWTARRL